MARKTTPNKSSSKEMEDQASSSNPVQLTQKPDYTKSQKNETLKPKAMSTASDSLMWHSNNYSNMLPVSQVPIYYPQTLPDVNSYEPYVDWNTMASLHMYNVPVLPMVVNPLQNLTPMAMEPLATSAMYGETGLYSSPNYVSNMTGFDVSPTYVEEYLKGFDRNDIQKQMKIKMLKADIKDQTDGKKLEDMFPPARNVDVDSNEMIDEFCKIDDITEHIPWFLDLEFGLPKAPVPRPVPIYDVQSNSIRCKNAPMAIHPGFEKLSPNFQKMLMFYYDCVISKWFIGYTAINKDKTVQSFQSWLNVRMQAVGMCWP